MNDKSRMSFQKSFEHYGLKHVGLLNGTSNFESVLQIQRDKYKSPAKFVGIIST